MDASEEVAANVVKGRRTKRSRVQSPLPHGLTANSSSGDGGASWSPTSSINEFQDSTEEEEDMANCLILLAKGHSRDFPKQQQHRQDYDSRGGGAYTTKFNSRKFLETANSTGSGKVGYYVYECKTCNRTFPSFQALGGHRASHKKPKATHNDERKKNLSLSSDEEDGGHYNNVSPLCLQLSDNNTNRGTYSNHNKGKIHECSVCGAEFTSGQALGGHMRRHRGPLSSTATLSLTPLAIESEKPKKSRNALSLDLDLNLPAPEDEKSSFASKQQQQHHHQQQQQQQQQNTSLVFPSPALVDCHY